MIITLCGYSGTGKTSVMNAMVDILGYSPIVSYTSRNPRPGESNKKDYNFVNNAFFDDNPELFLSVCEYGLYDGSTVKYGSLLSDYTENGNFNKISILSPFEIKKLADLDYKSRTIVVRLKADDEILIKRLIQRGDDEREVVRRLNADKEDFKDMSKYIDLDIDTGNHLPEAVANYIHSVLKFRRMI